ncbi:MAG: hypothetical protein JSV51_06960 [Candidatus Bathyarchaeota archaeon]|nr:MAG: hypothetical protein JSV51_06960 [Candidatus Bathyarchaeota archaeon]
MSFRKFFAIFLIVVTAVSMFMIVDAATIYFRSYAVPIVFGVSVKNVNYTVQESTVFIHTELLLQNPSELTLKIDYVGTHVGVNAFWLTREDGNPPYFPKRPGLGYVALLSPNSNESIEMDFSVPINRFPLNDLEKTWIFETTIIIRHVPILGQVWTRRYPIYNGEMS